MHGALSLRGFVLRALLGAIMAAGSLRSALAAPARTAAEATLESNGKAVRIVFKGGQTLSIPMTDTDAVQFDAPIVSEDRRTVAWDEELKLGASYPDSTVVYVYRDGKPVNFLFANGKPAKAGECFNGGTTLGWKILASGRDFYLACGFAHGARSEYRNLYDLDTGKLLGSIKIDNDSGDLPPGAPAWARAVGCPDAAMAYYGAAAAGRAQLCACLVLQIKCEGARSGKERRAFDQP